MIITTNKSYRLKSGYEMPVLGLGTWELKGKVCTDTVRKAIESGYRHIDTAELYENEPEIGEALKSFDREKLFITSKAASKNLGRDDLFKACQRSLSKLGTDYLDLYLMHWPNDKVPLSETLEAMQQLVDKRMIGSVGLSNFDMGRIKEALSVSSVPICNLQIEYHPFTHREKLPEFCLEEGITITAYCPLARGKVLNDPTLKKIAEKYDRTAAQVSLKWLVQKGNIVIPKASSEAHLRENMEIFDWELSEDDINSIDNIRNSQRLVDTRYT
jgi:diketogulonate reductase-like aldo/keto reductase